LIIGAAHIGSFWKRKAFLHNPTHQSGRASAFTINGSPKDPLFIWLKISRGLGQSPNAFGLA